MAGRQPVTWPSAFPNGWYELTAEPKDWWQRHVTWFPFCKDTKPAFILKITCLKSTSQTNNIEWIIKFSNGDITGGTVNIPQLQQGHAAEFMIGKRLLGFGGDTVLGIRMPQSNNHYETLMSFWVIRTETIFYGLSLALFSGIMGALITLLIKPPAVTYTVIYILGLLR